MIEKKFGWRRDDLAPAPDTRLGGLISVYEPRWNGDTLQVWDTTDQVPICNVFLARNPTRRMEVARIISAALNAHS